MYGIVWIILLSLLDMGRSKEVSGEREHSLIYRDERKIEAHWKRIVQSKRSWKFGDTSEEVLLKALKKVINVISVIFLKRRKGVMVSIERGSKDYLPPT